MVKSKKSSQAGRRKGDKRDRTRKALIEAATHIIKEKGYEKTSLDEVARRAGMTRGAIYGNFKNREDLFLAVIETRWKPIVPPLVQGASFREQMRILGKAVVAAAPERRASAIGALSFQLYALKHEAMRTRLARGNEQIYQWAAEHLLQYVRAKDLPMPAEKFVKLLHALIDGMLALRFLTPESFPDDLIISAFEALAGPGARRVTTKRRRT